MANLASTYRKQGRWEEAEKLFVKQGRWEEAEKLEVQSISHNKRHLAEAAVYMPWANGNQFWLQKDSAEQESNMALIPLKLLGRGAMRGHITVARLLLQHGADPNLQPTVLKDPSNDCSSGNTFGPPKTIAGHYGYLSMVKLLLAEKPIRDGNVSRRVREIEMVLTVAFRYRNADIITLLVVRVADTEAKDRNARSPLSLATTKVVAKILIDAGADLNSENTDFARHFTGQLVFRSSTLFSTLKPTLTWDKAVAEHQLSLLRESGI
ncbi:hypothetical protein QBC43DRAFT_349947 [Cladorrhinum sp. PSN259]|nr:hypothetical protein QBC43DRAFT_349947 [Cladorrhinum sp. PSN259]